MDSSSTCADSTIFALGKLRLYYDIGWKRIVAGLRVVSTFLSYLPPALSSDYEYGDLPKEIEDAIAEMQMEALAKAVKQGDETSMDTIRIQLLEKIKLCNRKVEKAYNSLSDYAVPQTQDPDTDVNAWERFIENIRATIRELNSTYNLTAAAMSQLEALEENLRLLQDFTVYLNTRLLFEESKDFWIHVRRVALSAARLVCWCWIQLEEDGKVAEDIAIRTADDLLLKIKPVSTEAVEMYFRVLQSQYKKYPTEYRLHNFLRLVLPCKVPVGPLVNLQKGLEFLLDFVLTTPKKRAEYVKPISSDIKAAVAGIASLKFSSRGTSENDVAIYLLLQKTELLKIEAVLIRLMSSTKWKGLTKEKFQPGLDFLRTTYIKIPPHENAETLTWLLNRIEAVAEEVDSLRSLSLPAQSTDYRLNDALKLLVNTNLLKAQAFLTELAVNYKGSSGKIVKKDQIETLNEGLELLRNFLCPEKQYPNCGNLAQIEALAKEAISIYYSLRSDLVKDEAIHDNNLSILQEKINLFKADAQGTYLKIRSSSTINFPRTDGMGFVEFFLEDLRQLLKHQAKADSVNYTVKNQTEAILKELQSVTSSIQAFGKQYKHQPPELKDLTSNVADLAYEADYAIDSILLKNGDLWYHMFSLNDVIEKLKPIKTKVEEIKEKKHDTGGLPHIVQIVRPIESQVNAPKMDELVVAHKDEEEKIKDAPKMDELVVAHKDEEEKIKDRLLGNKSFDFVPIVGMAGIGKTTLARKLYDDPHIKNQFHIHAWCSVSQVYRRRETLIKILSDVIESTGKNSDESDQSFKNKIHDQIHDKDDDGLLELLQQKLQQTRYIIVLDDIWDNQVWKDLGSAFPEDSYKGRILLTSREALEAIDDSDPVFLKPLSTDGSWELLKNKLFGQESCPVEFSETGKLIAERCNGLPLAAVTIAGLLKSTEMKVDWWKKIANDLNSRILEDEKNRCKHILELSYNHLPDHLKPCFLYFAAFGQGKEVPIQKLIRLWIAEGFVRKVDQESVLEDVAWRYVMGLINRSLVLADRDGSMGRVKACRIHDIFHEFCLSKAREENFVHSTTGYDKNLPPSSNLEYDRPSDSILFDQHRVRICSKREHFVELKPSGPRVRSLWFSAAHDAKPMLDYDIAFICCDFKLLRVLDIESINMGTDFPKGIELLDQLRYLAVSGTIYCIPSSIAKLWRLETLIVKGLRGKVALPDAIWRMTMLRHLHVNESVIFSLPEKSHRDSKPDNLVTLSSPSFQCAEDVEKILKQFLRLRKLRCIFSEWRDVSDNCIRFPILDFLTELVSLHIFYSSDMYSSCEFNFPWNLKKLTLSNFRVPWDCISVIGKLKHLQVLKLISHAFDSPTWDMKDGEFPELRFLKIDSSGITQWDASTNHLPKLETLILRRCYRLQNVPSSIFCNISLKMVELRWCSTSAEQQVREVQEEMEDVGVKVFINVLDGDF